MPRRKLNDAEIADILHDYEAGMPRKDLLTKYHISTTLLYKHRRLTNTPIRYFGAPHIRFFENIDSEDKAYWLGFVAADGCIISKFNKLNVGLSRKDREHLVRFKTALGVNTRISDSTVTCKSGRYPSSVLSVSSKGLVNDLKRLGVSDLKTYELSWPSIPLCLERHFIRGYVDGDGCWTITWSSHNLSIEVLGQHSFLTQMQERLVENCHLSYTKISPKTNCSAVSNLKYAGNVQCLRIANYLYEDAIVFLPRKRDVVLKHYASSQHHKNLRFA